MAAVATAALVGFTGCKEDTQPRLEAPTEFVLNTPAMAEQLYQMTPESTIVFTVSQPNYGLGCVPNYQVQIAATAEDFGKAEFDPEHPENGGYVTLEPITTSARIVIESEPFCLGACTLFGYTDNSNYSSEPKSVWVRVHAWVPNAEYSNIYSNAIELKAVQPYFAVKLPDLIWLVGQPEGWSAPAPGYPDAGEWTLAETEPGNKLYEGTFFIPEGQFQFRFYDDFNADEPWEWNSIGAQDADQTVDISMADGVYEGVCFYDPSTKGAGKGGWSVPGWAGGNVKCTVNLATKTVRFEKVD